MSDDELKSLVMNEELSVLPLTYAINKMYYGEIIIKNEIIQIVYSYLFGNFIIDIQNDTISSMQIEIQNQLSLNHNIKYNNFKKNNINHSLTVAVCF